MLIAQCFVYYICKMVTLLYSRLRFSETELMQRYPRLEVCVMYILLSRSFSKILDITGKILIGLYEVTSVGFFPSFGIMMIFACFRGTCQYSNLVIALHINFEIYYRGSRP